MSVFSLISLILVFACLVYFCYFWAKEYLDSKERLRKKELQKQYDDEMGVKFAELFPDAHTIAKVENGVWVLTHVYGYSKELDSIRHNYNTKVFIFNERREKVDDEYKGFVDAEIIFTDGGM